MQSFFKMLRLFESIKILLTKNSLSQYNEVKEAITINLPQVAIMGVLSHIHKSKLAQYKVLYNEMSDWMELNIIFKKLVSIIVGQQDSYFFYILLYFKSNYTYSKSYTLHTKVMLDRNL